MATDAVNAAANSAAQTTTAKSTTVASKGLGENFNNFLRLLTTQMQNQDPLKPLDNNEMTAQLVAFAQVEQSIGTNDRLDRLVALQNTSAGSSNLNYLGRRIEASGEAIALQNGAASVVYELPESATAVRIDVFDKDGNKVRELSGGSAAQGVHRYVWDGTNESGTQLADGAYRINVAVTSPKDKTVVAKPRSTGLVTGLDYKDGEPVLKIGDGTVAVNTVLAVRATAL